MTVPLRAALYLRVSTARQAEHDVSIPDQKRQGEGYCQSRGYQLVETYVEPGASATNDRRPEFQRMIEAGTSKPAPFDVVVVHSFSRFFRDHFELEFYVRKLAKNGVRLVSITQEMGDDPMQAPGRLAVETPLHGQARHAAELQIRPDRQCAHGEDGKKCYGTASHDGVLDRFPAPAYHKEEQAMEQHGEIREAVERLCAGFPGEYWRRLDERRGYPSEFVAALTGAGYLGALIPEEYGGAGLPLSAAAAILETVHATGCNGAACHAQMYIMGTILRHGSEAQKQQYLPGIASGALRLQAFGVTEPGSGTDTTALRTFARRAGDEYVINGQKIWTSRAEHSDLMLLLARTTPRDQVAKKTHGLSTFIVDMRAALSGGMTIRPIRTMMNHNSCEVFFDDVRVPAANLVGEEGGGFRYILDGMNAERLLIAAECIGDARWFTEKSVAYANQRVLFGRPIGQNQGVQFPIARAYAQTRAAALLLQDGLQRFERGEACGEQANMAKMLAAEAAWAAGEACVQTHGGFGFAEEYDIERKFRETRLYQVAPVSTNMVLSYIAEHVLGLPRSY